MPLLLNGDCLELMKDITDDSVDLIFCDLPYNQTNCKWDIKIDMDKFWKQIMRIKKLHTPIFFTTTTKFGVDLITSAPKKCYFRYDIVWVKSAPAGFLSAKKMPMRKHEMIYVFYEKLPFYDLSSHKHKFLKEEVNEKYTYQQDKEKDLYGTDIRKETRKGKDIGKSPIYDPPLPVSVVKEADDLDEKYKNKGGLYSKISRNGLLKNEPHYNPPLPVSVVKQEPEPEPEPVVKDLRKDEHTTAYGTAIHHHCNQQRNGESIYDPPLPNTMLEIKSTRGKHSTEKPVALMEWVLKYYSKEGDVVLDPTMGSGSTGVACKNMNREFIGIEMDGEIYDTAVERIGL